MELGGTLKATALTGGKRAGRRGGRPWSRERRDRVAQARDLRRAEVIERTLREAAAAGERCGCPITPDMSLGDLRALEGGCRAPVMCCPVLDRIRRRLRA